MSFGETKVYFDGSHYIAIPHTTRTVRKRYQAPEEIITVIEEKEIEQGSIMEEFVEPSLSLPITHNNKEVEDTPKEEKVVKKHEKSVKNIKKLTKKEYFNELYMKYINLSKREKKQKIIEDMLTYFKNKQDCIDFMNNNFERKQRNLICRRVRMVRKANLANFNYFCTFTYDNKLHTEHSFRKALRTCFRNFTYRNGWKYMGIWERAPKTNRLHFHGLFYIPENSLPGEIVEVRDYSTQFNRMQRTFQSSFFNKKFGRSDFKEIDEDEKRLGNALAYLMKYIEKNGEKIVYSKGLPQYFISDILFDDIICTIGQEDKKLLLFDDFMCLDKGCYMGNVSPEVIKQMRKCN